RSHGFFGSIWLRRLGGSRTFQHALVCIPLYPYAKQLAFDTKLEMIFNYFDEKQNGRWGEDEFYRWLRALNKPGQRLNWRNIQRKFDIEYKMKVHPVLGCSVDELSRYYRRN